MGRNIAPWTRLDSNYPAAKAIEENRKPWVSVEVRVRVRVRVLGLG